MRPFLTGTLMSGGEEHSHLETCRSNNWFSSPSPESESQRGESRFSESWNSPSPPEGWVSESEYEDRVLEVKVY